METDWKVYAAGLQEDNERLKEENMQLKETLDIMQEKIDTYARTTEELQKKLEETNKEKDDMEMRLIDAENDASTEAGKRYKYSKKNSILQETVINMANVTRLLMEMISEDYE